MGLATLIINNAYWCPNTNRSISDDVRIV